MTIQFVNLTEEAAGLARIRHLRRTMWIVWLSGVPVMALAGLLDLPWLIGPIAVVWMGAYIVTSVRVVTARCPRCDEFYHLKWPIGLGGGGVLSQRCRNCGLSLRGETDA
jgi:hypothetical protein